MSRHNFAFDGAIIRNELDNRTLALLLAAPDQEVAWRVAIALWGWRHHDALDGLPDDLRERSRDLVVKHAADDQLYPSLFEQEPDILADWLRAWFERRRGGSSEFLPVELEEVIAGLPIETRVDLIAEVPTGMPFVDRVATQLVSNDLKVAKALFDREELGHLHGAALRGEPNEAWLGRALLALNHGWSPEGVVLETSMGSFEFSGEASAYWQKKVDAFQSLRVVGASQEPERERIVAAGIALYAQKRDADLRREHQERVFGRHA